VQLSPQRGHNSLAVFSAFELQNVLPDTLADVPIKSDQSSINGARDLLPCRKNHLADIAKHRARKN
jgi:hypothetical protein